MASFSNYIAGRAGSAHLRQLRLNTCESKQGTHRKENLAPGVDHIQPVVISCTKQQALLMEEHYFGQSTQLCILQGGCMLGLPGSEIEYLDLALHGTK